MSAETSVVNFELGPFEASATMLTPTLNGVSLCDLVSEFEAAEGFDVVGGYDGLVLDNFNFGDLAKYLLGRAGPKQRRGVVALLGCDCGEFYCWPLEARVTVDQGRAVWDQFKQPHRPERDYTRFGPFEFDEQQYRAALADVLSTLET